MTEQLTILDDTKENEIRKTTFQFGNITIHAEANEPSSEALEKANILFNTIAEDLPLEDIEDACS